MRSHEIVPKLKNHTKKVGDAKLPDMTPEERDEKEKKKGETVVRKRKRREGGIRERTLAKTSD